MKRAVVYFSLTENTKEAAEFVARQIHADIFRLTPVSDRKKSKAEQFLIGGMRATFSKGEAINPLPVDITEYDEIIIGTPIWSSKGVPAINTFLNDAAVREKICGVLTSSSDGDNVKCIKHFKKMLPNLIHTAALADRKHEASKDNMVKLEAFVKDVVKRDA